MSLFYYICVCECTLTHSSNAIAAFFLIVKTVDFYFLNVRLEYMNLCDLVLLL